MIVLIVSAAPMDVFQLPPPAATWPAAPPDTPQSPRQSLSAVPAAAFGTSGTNMGPAGDGWGTTDLSDVVLGHQPSKKHPKKGSTEPIPTTSARSSWGYQQGTGFWPTARLTYQTWGRKALLRRWQNSCCPWWFITFCGGYHKPLHSWLMVLTSQRLAWFLQKTLAGTHMASWLPLILLFVCSFALAGLDPCILCLVSWGSPPWVNYPPHWLVVVGIDIINNYQPNLPNNPSNQLLYQEHLSPYQLTKVLNPTTWDVRLKILTILGKSEHLWCSPCRPLNRHWRFAKMI